MVIKIQTREEVDDLDLMIDVFLAEHTGVKPDVVWVGEILYTHHRKLLGITFGTKEQHKRVKLLGWKLEHIEGRAWILEDGGIAVQVGINGPDLSVPIGWLSLKIKTSSM